MVVLNVSSQYFHWASRMAFLHRLADPRYCVLASWLLQFFILSSLSTAILCFSSVLSFVHHLLHFQHGLDHDTALSITSCIGRSSVSAILDILSLLSHAPSGMWISAITFPNFTQSASLKICLGVKVGHPIVIARVMRAWSEFPHPPDLEDQFPLMVVPCPPVSVRSGMVDLDFPALGKLV